MTHPDTTGCIQVSIVQKHSWGTLRHRSFLVPKGTFHRRCGRNVRKRCLRWEETTGLRGSREKSWVVCSRIQKWLCCTVSSAWWFSAGNQWMTQSKDKRQPSVRQQKTTPFFFLHDSWDEHLQDTDPNVSFKGCGLRPPPCQSPTC